MELRNWIEGELGVNLPIADLMQGLSVAGLAGVLLGQFVAGETAPPSRVAPPVTDRGAVDHRNGQAHHPVSVERAEQLLGQLDDLSNDEVDSLLIALQAETVAAHE